MHPHRVNVGAQPDDLLRAAAPDLPVHVARHHGAHLFGNGLKFHRPDVAPVVRVDAHSDGEHWEFAVTDNGIGVESEYAEKIFEIFQRLHGREVYAGTGIGLALVKKIVEFHGGRVWLDSTPREEPGTVIRFTLPVEIAGPTPQEAP